MHGLSVFTVLPKRMIVTFQQETCVTKAELELFKNDMEDKFEQLKRQTTTPAPQATVAFTACFDGDRDLEDGVVMKYDRVLYNFGQHYDPNTGRYDTKYHPSEAVA